MSGARDQIMAGIRRALKRDTPDTGPDSGSDSGLGTGEVDTRIATHPRGLIPQRAQIPHDQRVTLFGEMVEAAAATVDRVDGLDQVPQAVSTFLKERNLPQQVRLAPDPAIGGIDWSRAPVLETVSGRAERDDVTSVTGALVGIAETGTLMMTSGPDHPTTLNFLPDNHLVVLRTSQIVGLYEDGWDRLRAKGDLPRTVNFITGPSRTGDIEQRIQLGAHGPRRLHIILVDDGPGSTDDLAADPAANPATNKG